MHMRICSMWEKWDWYIEWSAYQWGHVLILFRPIRFLLIGVEQGTASRCCEVLGIEVLAHCCTAPLLCLGFGSLKSYHLMSKPITMMHTAGPLLSSIAYMYTCSIIVLATLPKIWERIPLKINNCVSMSLWLMVESILTYRQCQNQKHEVVHQEITNYP